MWDVLGYLNQNAGAAQVLLTFGLVVFAAVSGVAAWLGRGDTNRLAQAAKAQADATVRMAREMRRANVFPAGPKIDLVSVEAKAGSIQIVLENTGGDPAYRIKCSVKHPDFRGESIELPFLEVGDSARKFLRAHGRAGSSSDWLAATLEADYTDRAGVPMFSRRQSGNFEAGSKVGLTNDS